MAQSSWHRPPAGTTPREFFETWLPQAFAAFLSAGREGPSRGVRVRATLSGPDGGGWDIQPVAGTLTIDPPGAEKPDVWIRQTVADFRAALDGDQDLPELLPPTWSALDLLFLDPRDRDLLRQIDGRALLEIAGRRRRRWALDVGFGSGGVDAGRPRATVRVDGDTFAEVRDGRVPPVQPLLNGKLKLEGDRALAMQLLLLLGARLGRS